jgi:16S rRNA (uracil1498-N3)-methyltransferase
VSARVHTFRYLVRPAPAEGDLVALDAEDARHLVRVVRRGIGEPLEVFDGAGGVWAARVEEVGPEVRVRVGARRQAPRDAPVRLCVGLLDSARLDLVAEKAVELGVGALTVMVTERVRRAPAPGAWAHRRARLERVVIAASRQCGRARLLSVEGLVPFGEIVSDTPAGTGLLIDPRGETSVARAAARGAGVVGDGSGGRLTVAVGPEAGFGPAEVEAARAAGWMICGLGRLTLRAETAAIAAATLACAELGHLGGTS